MKLNGRNKKRAAASGVNFEVAGEREYESKVLFRRSLYIVEDIKKGEKLMFGLSVNQAVSRGTPVSWDLVK